MKSLTAIFIILITLTLFNLPVQAASSTVMQVSATIRPWVTFNAVQHMYSYRVTAVDIQRGYVDLVGSITLEIKTNINGDISVRFSSEGGEKILFRESSGGTYFENEYRLNPDRQISRQVIRRNIDSRVILTRNAKEGEYPLNVFMTPEI